MRRDISGVAGFFEDLPVLLIVLAGIATLVVSTAYAGERMRAQSLQDELDYVADRFVDSVVMSLATDPLIEHTSISAIESVNATRCACESFGSESFEISFIMRYPTVEWIRSLSCADNPLPLNTGYASRLLSAVLDNGTIGVVEVSAVVWM